MSEKSGDRELFRQLACRVDPPEWKGNANARQWTDFARISVLLIAAVTAHFVPAADTK
jgi:hypothetical protein